MKRLSSRTDHRSRMQDAPSLGAEENREIVDAKSPQARTVGQRLNPSPVASTAAIPRRCPSPLHPCDCDSAAHRAGSLIGWGRRARQMRSSTSSQPSSFETRCSASLLSRQWRTIARGWTGPPHCARLAPKFHPHPGRSAVRASRGEAEVLIGLMLSASSKSSG